MCIMLRNCQGAPDTSVNGFTWLRIPPALSSVLAALGTLQLRAIGILDSSSGKIKWVWLTLRVVDLYPDFWSASEDMSAALLERY